MYSVYIIETTGNFEVPQNKSEDVQPTGTQRKPDNSIGTSQSFLDKDLQRNSSL